MLTIGLTGGIGSGKTQVADYFAERGAPVIDTDSIARELVVPGQPALQDIVAAFGETILTAEGELNRRALRQKIFARAEARRQLENILHPRIRDEVERRIQSITAPWCIIVIPLLVETGWQTFVQRILLVDSPTELQISRTMLRDHSDRDEVEKIIASQASRDQRRAAADDIIVNDASLEHLQQQVEKMHQFYNQLGGSCQNA